MQIQMLRDLIGVEKLDKSSTVKKGDIFASVDTTHNVGIIKYVGETLKTRFSPGQKIHFGNIREQIRINGADIIVMKEDNVFAIETDEMGAIVDESLFTPKT